jgi:hypothetical protein
MSRTIQAGTSSGIGPWPPSLAQIQILADEGIISECGGQPLHGLSHVLDSEASMDHEELLSSSPISIRAALPKMQSWIGSDKFSSNWLR